MRKNLLEFLFGESAVRESRTLGEDVVRLFEEAADEETEQMVANKKPLSTALKALGITDEIIAGPQSAELHCDSEEDYRDYMKLLRDPDNMHRLAEMGWVVAQCGDQAMSNEPAAFKIGFIEIYTPETSDAEKAPDLEKVLKDAQKFAASEVDHDDDLNPVEFDDKTSNDRKKGVGDPKDGADPEGKPKGSAKKTESVDARKVAEDLLEMTSASAIPAVEAPMSMPARSRFRKKMKKADEQSKPNR